MADRPDHTIKVAKIAGGDASADGAQAWLDFRTAKSVVRLTMPQSALADLAYGLLPLMSKSEERISGPGVFHAYKPDRIYAGEDVSAPHVLLLIVELGQNSKLVFEIPRSDASHLADEILSAVRPHWSS